MLTAPIPVSGPSCRPLLLLSTNTLPLTVVLATSAKLLPVEPVVGTVSAKVLSVLLPATSPPLPVPPLPSVL